MADHIITISNSINSLGPAPSTKWGSGSPYTMTWGTSKWGEGTQDLIVEMIKLITNTVTPSDALFNSIDKVVGNDLTVTSETTSEELLSGNGYFYLFPLPTTDAEDRNLSTYTSGTAAATTYIPASQPSTSWS
jgi:hypothetical protein